MKAGRGNGDYAQYLTVTEIHSFAQLFKYSSGLGFAALEDGEMNGRNRAAEQSPDLYHFLPTISVKDNVV
jgi:hypothetical protein